MQARHTRRTGPALASGEHLFSANDDAGDLTDEDLSAIDREFGIDLRDLERACDQRASSREMQR